MLTKVIKTDVLMGKTAVSFSPEPPASFDVAELVYRGQHFRVTMPTVRKADFSQPMMFYVDGIIKNGVVVELIEATKPR